ncbi:MAG: prepilin-type N-terminal cleavage/methylation domain-containing protein [Xanthomonadales bacterium]|nr:prepilin-type N-terminal cleavage/methylation domain-containing protein [Xanthomonadales bacterium]
MNNQSGFGLMEMLISMALSLLAVTIMVVLMANTLGTGSETIQMSRLSQQLRASIQLMSRDLRRANYHSGFLNCFANANCRNDLNIAAYINTIQINTAGNCFWYWLDRDGDADLSNDSVGGFRYSTIGGVGVIQMRVSGNSAANCDDGTDWELITDPGIVDITNFSINNLDSYTENLSTTGDVQSVEKIRLSINGRMAGNHSVQREIQDLILIRNDIQSAGT